MPSGSFGSFFKSFFQKLDPPASFLSLVASDAFRDILPKLPNLSIFHDFCVLYFSFSFFFRIPWRVLVFIHLGEFCSQVTASWVFAKLSPYSQSEFLGQFLMFPCRVGGLGPHSLSQRKNRISILVYSLAPRIHGKLLLTLIVGSPL